MMYQRMQPLTVVLSVRLAVTLSPRPSSPSPHDVGVSFHLQSRVLLLLLIPCLRG